MKAQVATRADLDRVTEILTAAFASDPLWSWAFPEVDALAAWWRFCISSAMRYPWVWIADDYAAASVWIPPGGVELTDAEEARVEGLLDDLIGPRGPEVLRLLERFEESHPVGDDPPAMILATSDVGSAASARLSDRMAD